MSSLTSYAFRDYEQAYYAERNGDLSEALRLYELVYGFMESKRRIEKDGLVIEVGSLANKIDRLERRVRRAAGLGQLRRIPVTTGRPEALDEIT